MNLGYSVTDNASNNDTGLETLSQSLSNIYEIHYDVSSCRLRCNGHIINLVVKTLLFGAKGVIKDDKSNEIAALTGSYKGALAKLHHVVHHIRITPQRRDLFLSEQATSLSQSPDFIVVADNATQWNSQYNMITAALRVRPRIDGYIRLVGIELAQYSLSDKEWEDLEQLKWLLISFEKVTRATQGNDQGQGSITSVLMSMDMLLDRLEQIKSEGTTTTSVFHSTVDLAWAKLDKYYAMTERSKIYIVSIVLHPCLKMRYFEWHWADHPDWIKSA
jgi:hypothetical protein